MTNRASRSPGTIGLAFGWAAWRAFESDLEEVAPSGDGGGPFPDRRARDTSHGDRPRLAPATPLDHALEGLQGVEPIRVERAIAERERIGQLRPDRQGERRDAPGHRQRRPGHERESLMPGEVVHPAGEPPVVGEVLVAEDRHPTPQRTERVDDPLEQATPRVERLPLRIHGVIPMLADDQDPLDRHPPRADPDGAGDRREDRDAVLAAVAPAQVLLRELVGVDGRELQAEGPFMPPGLGLQQAREDDVGMAVGPPFREDCGHRLRCGGLVAHGPLRPPGAGRDAPLRPRSLACPGGILRADARLGQGAGEDGQEDRKVAESPG